MRFSIKVGTLLTCSLLTASIALGQADEGQKESNKKKGLVEQLSGQGYGMAGCGLGSILFGEQEGMIQVFAATTNGIYSHQTFAISSGTSNCNAYQGDTAAAEKFLDSNRDTLESEIAKGRGESLNTFAGLMGCAEAPVVAMQLQRNFEAIFPSVDASNEEVMTQVKNVILVNKLTAHACGQQG